MPAKRRAKRILHRTRRTDLEVKCRNAAPEPTSKWHMPKPEPTFKWHMPKPEPTFKWHMPKPENCLGTVSTFDLPVTSSVTTSVRTPSGSRQFYSVIRVGRTDLGAEVHVTPRGDGTAYLHVGRERQRLPDIATALAAALNWVEGTMRVCAPQRMEYRE